MSERPVVIGAGSFSVDSGGRTTASFTRASVLAESGWKVTIATTNFKVEYGRIFESWAGRFGVRGLVDHANFFEWCAGTQLYSIEEEHVEFPPRVLRRRLHGCGASLLRTARRSATSAAMTVHSFAWSRSRRRMKSATQPTTEAEISEYRHGLAILPDRDG